MQKNKEIAQLFTRFADILEFQGENVFKINAYRKASRVISDSNEDIEMLWKEKRLSELSGIGKALQEKISEYIETGKVGAFENLVAEIPKELFTLLSIPGYGPKTAALAYKELNVETMEDLQRVLEDGRLAALPGMGTKKIMNLKKGIEFLKNASEKVSIAAVMPVVQAIIDHMQNHKEPLVNRILPAGSIRRFKETVHDIDILVESDKSRDTLNHFLTFPAISRKIGAGTTKASVILADGSQVDLRVVPPVSFGAALQYFTGSQAHNIRVRELARKKGLKINEYGVFQQERQIAGESEAEVYQSIGMPFIAPELREDRGEIEAALENCLPDLIEIEDIKGDLHIHSLYSDGHLSIAEMAGHLRDFGYEYAAFCDHSKSAFYANGLSEERLWRQQDEIRALNQQYSDFTILSGSEVDILPDGTLDFSDSVLEQLDFVIASIHSAFKSDPTGRIIAAMKNPFVDVIGHPTGRLISRREAYSVEMKTVIDMAVKTGTALEINSFWDRLDLNDMNSKLAVESGVKLAINTDSHNDQHLEMIQFGVGTARRGWCSKDDVINAWELKRFKEWQKRNRL